MTDNSEPLPIPLPNMTTKQKEEYDPRLTLAIFRENVHKRIQIELDDPDTIYLATPVDAIFHAFLMSNPTPGDIHALLRILSNEDSHEWDSIAHWFC